MNEFLKLLGLDDSEKKRLGVVDTPREIRQQPQTWDKAVDLVTGQKEELKLFLRDAGLAGEKESTLVMCGAGTSEFIGNSVCNLLRKGFKREVVSIPTTSLVTHGRSILVEGRDYTVLSFARSGNSPESVPAYAPVKKL